MPDVAAADWLLADGPLAVLVSGGLDSAILLGEAVRTGRETWPLYVRCGFHWEAVELDHLRRFLDAIKLEWPAARLHGLQALDMPVGDLYPRHWSLTGQGVPAADSPDEAVFLPGRNILLLAKAMLWCHLHGVTALALAPLATNPFADATEKFFRAFEAAVNEGIGGAVRVLRPYASLHKPDVMRRGAGFPVALTFSCIRPVRGRHCGRCNKCAERRRAFAEAQMADPTAYAAEESCTA